jgi:hypothetical protein
MVFKDFKRRENESAMLDLKAQIEGMKKM